jgi:hypothetical protein
MEKNISMLFPLKHRMQAFQMCAHAFVGDKTVALYLSVSSSSLLPAMRVREIVFPRCGRYIK